MSASTDLWETWRSNPQVHPIETTSDSTVEFEKNTVRFCWGMSNRSRPPSSWPHATNPAHPSPPKTDGHPLIQSYVHFHFHYHDTLITISPFSSSVLVKWNAFIDLLSSGLSIKSISNLRTFGVETSATDRNISSGSIPAARQL